MQQPAVKERYLSSLERAQLDRLPQDVIVALSSCGARRLMNRRPLTISDVYGGVGRRGGVRSGVRSSVCSGVCSSVRSGICSGVRDSVRSSSVCSGVRTTFEGRMHALRVRVQPEARGSHTGRDVLEGNEGGARERAAAVGLAIPRRVWMDRLAVGPWIGD